MTQNGSPRAGGARSPWLALVLSLPWLYPFASGPSPAVEPWLFSAACAALGWVLLSLDPVPPDIRTVMEKEVPASWAMAAIVSSAMGLLQYFDLARALGHWVSIAPMGEAFGNLRQRNLLATLTNVGLLAILWWQHQHHRASCNLGAPVPIWATAGTVAATALFAACNAATTSRTGLMQLLLVTLLAVTWRNGPLLARRMTLCGLAMMSYLVAAAALPEMLEQVTGQRGNSLLLRLSEEPRCQSRMVLWSNVLDLITRKPWLGWGWGELDYAHFATLYDGPRFCAILDNAHNLPLHLAVELGIPVALLVCASLAIWVIRARPWRETNPARQLAWGVLAVIGLHSLLEYPLWYGPFQIAASLSVWLLWRTRADPAQPAAMRQGWLASWGRLLAPLLALACLGYAAWDYRRISQIYLPAEQRAQAYREDTLGKLQGSWLFRDQVSFARLTITPLTRENAQWVYRTASDLLHYSPEPRVIEKLIESAVMLGYDKEALAWLARYRAAFPAAHARWAKGLTAPEDAGVPSGGNQAADPASAT